MGRKKYTSELIELLHFIEKKNIRLRYSPILKNWEAEFVIEKGKHRRTSIEIRDKHLQKLLEEVRKEYEK